MGLQTSAGGGKKVFDVNGGEKQEHASEESPSGCESTSPSSGDDVQWCDLLSFRSVVCALPVPADADVVASCTRGASRRQRDEAASGQRQPPPPPRQTIRTRILNFHYLDAHRMEFRPRALTRRLCGGKKHDNELYRSNSFKFERFERPEDSGLLQKQVSLCDDYSVPVDFVNQKTPHTFGCGLVNWTTPSPSGEPVEIVAAYCDPRDSKAYLEPGEEASGKLYTSPDRDYSQPYTDFSSGTRSPDGDGDDGVYEDVGLPREPLVGVVNNCVTIIRVGDQSEDEEFAEELGRAFQDPPSRQVCRRNPSPYYYGDLYKEPCAVVEEDEAVTSFAGRTKDHGYRKSVSLDTACEPVTSRQGSACVADRRCREYKKSASLDVPTPASTAGDVSVLSVAGELGHDAKRSESLLAACLFEWDALMPPLRQLRADEPPSVCACAAASRCVAGNREDLEDERLSRPPPRRAQDGRALPEPDLDEDYSEAEDEFDEMSGNRRHLYETAFDCKVSRSDDDLDDVDRVTNHPVLQTFGSAKPPLNGGRPLRQASSSQDSITSGNKERRKITLLRGKFVKERPKSIPQRILTDTTSSTISLSQGLDGLELNSSNESKLAPSPLLALRGFTSSPPSTAPLPTKFHGKEDLNSMNSIQSAPDLPVSSPGHPRLKDLRLPVKSLRAREDSRKEIIEFKGRPKSFLQDASNKEIAARPKSMFHDSESILEFSDQLRKRAEGTILEIKGRPGDPTSGPVLEFAKSRLAIKETANILEIKGRPRRRSGVRLKFSSTESMATSSSGGSLESIRSSTSEGNRSTTSSESPRSSSLSSHSSDSGGSCGLTTINLHMYHHHHHHHQTSGTPGGVTSRFFSHQSNKLHILSPISDKSSLEPASETSDNNRNNNSQKASPEDADLTQASPPMTTTTVVKPAELPWETGIKVKRRTPQNKNLINLGLQQSCSSGDAEVQGSDSGISLDSRGTTKNGKGYSGSGFAFINTTDSNIDNLKAGQQTDFSDLPFDMPKLRRRRLQQQDTCTSGSATSVDLHELPFDMPKLRRRLQQDTCTSGSATSVDLHDLPFDMPKLRRRLRGGPAQSPTQTQTSTESSGVSQASSSQSVQEVDRSQAAGVPVRPSLTLNLDGGSPPKHRMGLCLNFGGAKEDVIDPDIPLDRQGWYHGNITRLEAESILRSQKEGSYLVRNSESTKQDYSLSLKSARGFMHMRIQLNKETGKFILGQFSNPFDNIPEMIRHYTLNRLPIRGAEHMCLLHAVIEQLL